MTSAVVFGARTVRQGIGPWVARTFAELGVDVRGVAGSSPATAAQAANDLKERFGIECRAHASPAEALAAERPDVVAICTPYGLHREHLELAAAAGAHALCEKPLWWEAHEDRAGATAAIVDRFRARGLHLSTLTQWPCTLPSYFELFPALRLRAFERFEMKLGPTRIDELAVVDSAPHALSVLERVFGLGDVESATWTGSQASAELTFAYRHERGRVDCRLELERHPHPPRPAGYGFDGHWAERQIEPETYAMSFVSDGRSVRFADPLRLRLSEFLASAQASEPTDREALTRALVNLERLVEAV